MWLNKSIATINSILQFIYIYIEDSDKYRQIDELVHLTTSHGTLYNKNICRLDWTSTLHHLWRARN